jgi:hypothetical protein
MIGGESIRLFKQVINHHKGLMHYLIMLSGEYLGSRGAWLCNPRRSPRLKRVITPNIQGRVEESLNGRLLAQTNLGVVL